MNKSAVTRDRKPGHYWVQLRDHGWSPAYWNGETWFVLGQSGIIEITLVGLPCKRPQRERRVYIPLSHGSSIGRLVIDTENISATRDTAKNNCTIGNPIKATLVYDPQDLAKRRKANRQ